MSETWDRLGAVDSQRALDLAIGVPVFVVTLPLQAVIGLTVRRHLGSPVISLFRHRLRSTLKTVVRREKITHTDSVSMPIYPGDHPRECAA